MGNEVMGNGVIEPVGHLPCTRLARVCSLAPHMVP